MKTKYPFYFISDTHFDHVNIIKYCNRPFPDVRVMNRELIRNWNSVVHRGEYVYFLGDLTYGREHKPVSYWLNRLNGRKIMIKGSHDNGVHKAHQKLVIEYGGIKFYLVHDPKDIPQDWDGWAIHGHIHNKGDFFNFKRKRINVSAEQINYTPVSIDTIIARIKKYERR